jgi:hypothetical protein
MYGPGTEFAFFAEVDPGGYRLTLARDRSPIVIGTAGDSTALFRISQDLRSQLQRLGYDARPLPQRASVLSGGGLCWGPGAPIHSSLLESLH